MNTTEKTYERAADTAKKIRTALKAKFAGVKFSVTSKTYSGGSSVDITWTDGPLCSVVEDVTKAYQSVSFDGMTDSSDFHGYTDPTDGRRYMGAHYVFCHRDRSPELCWKLDAELAKKVNAVDLAADLHRFRNDLEAGRI